MFSGVRAVLIEKHQKPSWKPSTLEEVPTKETIDYYFGPLEPEKELLF